jgi:hypothetical protein
VVWLPWSTPASAPSCISSSQKSKTGGAIGEIFRSLYGAENREKELSNRQKSAEEIPSQMGEISAIAIVIELDFIGIIIIITSTIIISPSHCKSWVESCLVHRGNFPGVNYYLQSMLFSETIGLRFMFRLLFIIISSLIMIHMMYCE